MTSDMERHAVYFKTLWTEETNSGFEYKPQVKCAKEYNFDSMSEFCY